MDGGRLACPHAACYRTSFHVTTLRTASWTRCSPVYLVHHHTLVVIRWVAVHGIWLPYALRVRLRCYSCTLPLLHHTCCSVTARVGLFHTALRFYTGRYYTYDFTRLRCCFRCYIPHGCYRFYTHLSVLIYLTRSLPLRLPRCDAALSRYTDVYCVTISRLPFPAHGYISARSGWPTHSTHSSTHWITVAAFGHLASSAVYVHRIRYTVHIPLFCTIFSYYPHSIGCPYYTTRPFVTHRTVGAH